MNAETQQIITAWADAKRRFITAYERAAQALAVARAELKKTTGQNLTFVVWEYQYDNDRIDFAMEPILRGDPPQKFEEHWPCSWTELQKEIKWLESLSGPDAWIKLWASAKRGR